MRDEVQKRQVRIRMHKIKTIKRKLILTTYLFILRPPWESPRRWYRSAGVARRADGCSGGAGSGRWPWRSGIAFPTCCSPSTGIEEGRGEFARRGGWDRQGRGRPRRRGRDKPREAGVGKDDGFWRRPWTPEEAEHGGCRSPCCSRRHRHRSQREEHPRRTRPASSTTRSATSRTAST